MAQRKATQWTICELTGNQAIGGLCPDHGGDVCLVVVTRKSVAPVASRREPRKRTMFRCPVADCNFHSVNDRACPRHPQAKLKRM